MPFLVKTCSQIASYFGTSEKRGKGICNIEYHFVMNVMSIGVFLHKASSFKACLVLGIYFIPLVAVKAFVVHSRVFSSSHFIVGWETRRFVPLCKRQNAFTAL